MKAKIDKWIEDKKKSFIDCNEYFNKNLPSSAKFFDDFIEELPINIIDPTECYQMINEERLTYKERKELLKYLEDKLSDIKYEQSGKREAIFEKVDNLFNSYLYTKFKYNGKNKDKIFKSIQYLLDYDSLDYESIESQFMQVQDTILEIIDWGRET